MHSVVHVVLEPLFAGTGESVSRLNSRTGVRTLCSQEAFTGVTIKGGDLETGGDATFQPVPPVMTE